MNGSEFGLGIKPCLTETFNAQNCAGFVYYRLGLRGSDRYIDPGTIDEQLMIFDEVPVTNVKSNDVICFFWDDLKYVIHMALVGLDGFAFQRDRYRTFWEKTPVQTVRLEDLIETFTKKGAAFLYLRPKASTG